MKKRTRIGLGLVGLVLGLMSLAPQAGAAFHFSGLTVSQDGKEVGYGRGNVSVEFLWVHNNAEAKVGDYNGRGVYVQAFAWNMGQTLNIRSKNTVSTTWESVKDSTGYGAPTQAPWWASSKACVDVPFWFDTCGEEKRGRAY